MSNFRVPYLVGNKITRDHQFWPVADAPLVDADQVIVVDRDVLEQMAWRVREWKISGGSMSWHSTASLPGAFSGTWAEFTVRMKRLTLDMSDNRDVTDERDILGPATDTDILGSMPTLRNYGVRGTKIFTTWSPSTATADHSIGVSIFAGTVYYDTDRKLFAPPFGVRGSLVVPGVHPGIFFGTVAASDLVPANNATGKCTIVNPTGGANFVLPMEIFGQDVFGIPGHGTVSDITMTPTKWWPYKNSLGQPVYDEITGAQVNDPG